MFNTTQKIQELEDRITALEAVVTQPSKKRERHRWGQVYEHLALEVNAAYTDTFGCEKEAKAAQVGLANAAIARGEKLRTMLAGTVVTVIRIV